LSGDLSKGGVRVRVDDFIPLDTELTLRIWLNDEEVVECAGRIVWIEKARFGDSYQAGLEFAGNDSVLGVQKIVYGFLSNKFESV